MSGEGRGVRGRALPLVMALTLLAAGAFVWSPYLNAPFVLDDAPTIVNNASIRNLADPGALLNPPADSSYQGRPLGNVLAAVNLAVGGPSSYSFHLVNLALHLAACLLLFDLLRRTLRSPAMAGKYGATADPLAFLAALVWLLHPLHAGAVGYVTQRVEMLAALFLLLVLCAISRLGSGQKGRGWWALAVASAFLAAATKETAVALPVAALLYDRAFLSGSFGGALKARGNLHALLASSWLLLALLIAGAGSRNATVGVEAGLPYSHHLLTQAGAVALYLKLALWPQPLVFDYGPLAVFPLAFTLPAMLAVIALLALAFREAGRNTPAGFLGALFFALLAPTSSFIPLRETVVEYRMYLPLAALSALVVCGGWKLVEGKARGRTLASVALLAAAALGAVTLDRSDAFSTDLALWRDTVVKAPKNPRARVSLGSALFDRGDLLGAEAQLREAVALDDTSFRAWSNLGVARLALNRDKEALEALEKALGLRPADDRTRYNYGRALLRTGQGARAAQEFRRVAAGGKAPPQVLSDMADLLAGAGLYNDAAALRRTAAP